MSSTVPAPPHSQRHPLPADVDTIQATEAARVSTVRARLVTQHVFWASMIMPMQLTQRLTLHTYGATDCCDHIYYNPLLTRTLTYRQLGFLLVHEAMHVAFFHLLRRQGRRVRLWNHACDYVVNWLIMQITQDGQQLYNPIPGMLYNVTYRSNNPEEVYEHLLQHPPPLDGKDNNPADPGDFGGGVDSHLEPPGDPAVEDRIKERLLQAHELWESSKHHGHLPQSLLRQIAALRRPTVPWHTVLRRYAGQCLARNDYTYTPPHRRRLVLHDLITPSLRSEQAGHLVISIDTSGSIDLDKLTAFVTHVTTLAEYAEDLTLLSHDAAVHTVIRTQDLAAFIRQLTMGTATLRGGGGTDHRPVFEWISQHRLSPDLLICCTDMASEFPERAPHYPVLWCVTKDDAQPRYPFGEAVVIPTDQP